MRRDDDYLRSMLMHFEAQPGSVFVDPIHMNMTESEAKQHYHIQLAMDAGLLCPAGKGTFRMTNASHDYLAAIKNDSIWAKTKAAVAEQGGSASLEIVKAIAAAFLRKQIEQRTGLTL